MTVTTDSGERLTTPAGDIVRIVLLGLFFLGLALITRQWFTGDTHRWLLEWREALQGSGLPTGRWASAAIFGFVSAALIALGLPRLWISTLAGALYGMLLGIALAMLASLLGATIAYLAGRWLLADTVQRRLRGKLETWHRRFRQNAFWWVLYARLFPLSNSTLTSLVCGSSKVSLAQYLGASCIGFLPLTVIFASFGSGGIKGNVNQVLLGFGLLLLAVMFRPLLRGMLSESPPPPGSTPTQSGGPGSTTTVHGANRPGTR